MKRKLTEKDIEILEEVNQYGDITFVYAIPQRSQTLEYEVTAQDIEEHYKSNYDPDYFHHTYKVWVENCSQHEYEDYAREIFFEEVIKLHDIDPNYDLFKSVQP